MQGRLAELERINSLVLEARRGSGGALMLGGEAGIGKTTLLRAAREEALAAGFEVVHATGVESEASLPFAALGEIVGPLGDHLDELPEHRADSLRAAVGMAPSTPAPGDTLAVFAGFLALLEAAASSSPLLILLDDVQWFDPSSSACLAYGARRLEDRPVALLAALRTEGAEGSAGWEIPEMHLGGLRTEEARQLLAATASDLEERAVAAVVETAAGNPLALHELPGLLTRGQRSGHEPIDVLPPPEGALADALARRIAVLGEDSRRALLVLAAAPNDPPAVVVGACEELAIGADAFEQAESAGLITVGERQITFAHPLLRGAVEDAAPPDERRRAHRALGARSEPDSAAWHLAAAAIGADDEAAEALERAGHSASTRGAHATAADALERAASLTTAAEGRSARLLQAGLAAAMGGDYSRAVDLLEKAGTSGQPQIRRASRHLLAMACLTGGVRGAYENHGLLDGEAKDALADDRNAAAAMFADSGVIAVVAGDCRLALESAERAVEALDQSVTPTTRCQALSILGMGLALAGRAGEAREALDEAGALLREIDPLSPAAQSISFALGARLSTGQERKLSEEVRGLAKLARESRSIGLLPYFQLQAADSAFRLGDWDAAVTDARLAASDAEASSQLGPLSIALVVLARVLGMRGEVEHARQMAQRGIEIATPRGYGATIIWGQSALGATSLATGDPDRAIEELEPLSALCGAAGLEDPVIVPWAPDLVEALARAGRAEDARAQAARFSERAERSHTALALALAARCEGIVGEDHTASMERFGRALELHAEAELPFERARTLLCAGAQLHREGVRREARERLRESLALFDRLGAAPWAEQARAELAAAGALERPRSSDDDALTPRELEVAHAVARGATNREVAAELFLSPKTIEFHLGRVYGKLGVRSRTELAAIAAEGGLAAVEKASART